MDGPRLGQMGREALSPRSSECHKEETSYFDKEALGATTSKCHTQDVSYFNKTLEEPQNAENSKPWA
jgi:hypothetical protein